MGDRSYGIGVLVFLLVPLLRCGHGLNTTSELSELENVVARSVQPTHLQQYITATVTVGFNSSICSHIDQEEQLSAQDVQLVLQGSSAAGRDQAFYVDSISSNCTFLDFVVSLDGSNSRPGIFTAYLLLPKQHQQILLPSRVSVAVPLLLAAVASEIKVPSDQRAFEVAVQLNRPAAEHGVSVGLHVDDNSVQVDYSIVSWGAGTSGTKAFRVSLKSAPASGRIQARLTHARGAVINPGAAVTDLVVQSPIVGFKPDLGYYRGVNFSIPLLYFTVSGTSGFPSGFSYTTYLLSGSRPSSVPCHPLAASCSLADVEAVSNITIFGTRWLRPGQQNVGPIELPINWGRLAPEAELRVTVRITPNSNVRVMQQTGHVAAIVFGTPPGRCPPGSMVLSNTSSQNTSYDGPTYTTAAALQELALVLQPEMNSSSNGSGGGGTEQVVQVEKLVVAPQLLPKTSVSGCNSSSNHTAAAGTLLDLDPPFRPMMERYVALLPPRPGGGGKLLLASSRWGDVVVVDATACTDLDSTRYDVAWGHNQQLWRQRYSLAGQMNPCWLRVHVFTKHDDGRSSTSSSGGFSPSATAVAAAAAAAAAAAPDAAAWTKDVEDHTWDASTPYDGGSSSSVGSDSAANITASSNMWSLPPGFVLYRSYTIRFVPLRPPEQLSLRAIMFSNNDTTVIACGVPSTLSHLFQTAAAAPGTSSSTASAAAAGLNSSTYQQPDSSSSNNGTGVLRVHNMLMAPSSVLSSFASLQPDATMSVKGAGMQGYSNSSSNRDSSDQSRGLVPRPLQAAPGQKVQVAYLVMVKPGSISGSSSRPAAGQQRQQREQGQVTAAAAAVAAAGLNRIDRLEQYSLYDPVSNKTIVWSRFTAADCTQDRYILLPLAQLKPDMKMVPELFDQDSTGVNITMTEAALALAGSLNNNQSDVTIDVAEPVATVSGDKEATGPSVSAAAAVDGAATAAQNGGQGVGGLGAGNVLDGVLCNKQRQAAASSISSSVLNTSNNSSIANGTTQQSSSCGMKLPGVTAELPIIITADEGRSSKTYTLLLYSNETAAAAVRNLVLPQEAAAAAGTAGSSSSSISSDPAAEAASLSAAYFATRPTDWPKSPAQSGNCGVCPNGTYSTRMDAQDCQVCPPGKYAALPFSTQCLSCPPGTFSYYWGASTCRSCLPGTYAAAAGSLFCDICRDGTTTSSGGARSCDMSVTGTALAGVADASDYAILVSFGVVVDGAALEAVTRSTTGINGSSEGIVAVLIQGDTATALNVSLGDVQVLGVQQIGTRQLLVNVSATVPVPAEAAAAAATDDLSADQLIQRLIDDPNTFLRTTQTLGAESASVQDVIAQKTHRWRFQYFGNIHALLWPTLFGAVLLLIGLLYGLWKLRKRQRLRRTQQALGGIDFEATAAAVAAPHAHSGNGLAGLVTGMHGRNLRARVLAGVSGGFRSGAVAADFVADLPMQQHGSSSSSKWHECWQQFWSSDVRLVMQERGLSRNSNHSHTSSDHSSRNDSVTGSSGSSHTNESDGLSVTLAVDGMQGSSRDNTNQGVPLSEESFEARLRVKQIETVGAALSYRHQTPSGCLGRW